MRGQYRQISAPTQGAFREFAEALLEAGYSPLPVIPGRKKPALGKRPIAPAEFPAAIASICERAAIAIRDDGADRHISPESEAQTNRKGRGTVTAGATG
jgi:hypothetical protein